MKDIRRILLVASMGLGLGLGVTVSVLSPQSAVTASHPQQTTISHAVEVKKITINESLIYSATRDKNNKADFYETTSHGLGQGKTTVLRGTGTRLESQLEQLKIGTTLRVLGSNNGYYTFTVTEIVTIPRDHSSQLVSDTSEQVVLSVHARPWDTTETAFIASYLQ